MAIITIADLLIKTRMSLRCDVWEYDKMTTMIVECLEKKSKNKTDTEKESEKKKPKSTKNQMKRKHGRHRLLRIYYTLIILEACRHFNNIKSL